jgi:N-acetylglucosaminyl-diphospho-decaprenol L-rhamnosyltransferase
VAPDLSDHQSKILESQAVREIEAAVDVTVIVVSYNTAHLLDKMFASIDASRGHLNTQIVVVDNASRDRSVSLLRDRYPTVELIVNTTNVGFGRANNQAAQRARGRYILLLNTDAFLAPDTLVKTVGFMDLNAKCGVLGVKLVSADGSLQPSCRYFPTPWNTFVNMTGLSRLFPFTRLVDDMSWDHKSLRQCDWVPGCFYMVRREVIKQVGLFDPRYFLYWEEIDHCLAVRRAGWDVIFFPDTTVVHIGGESAASDKPITKIGRQIQALEIESRLLFFRKNHGIFGLVASVLFGMFADILLALKALARLDSDRAVSTVRRSLTMIRLLANTRIASTSTIPP